VPGGTRRFGPNPSPPHRGVERARAMAMIDTSVLSPKQVDLLRTFVEAERRVPKDYQVGFRGPTYQEISRITLYHRGLPNEEMEVSGTDIFALAEEGLVTILRTPDLSAIRVHVNPEGEAYRDELEERQTRSS
jgi:hypothetical protein